MALLLEDIIRELDRRCSLEPSMEKRLFYKKAIDALNKLD